VQPPRPSFPTRRSSDLPAAVPAQPRHRAVVREGVGEVGAEQEECQEHNRCETEKHKKKTHRKKLAVVNILKDRTRLPYWKCFSIDRKSTRLNSSHVKIS